MGKTYEINNLQDFLKIPPDRFETFVREMTNGIKPLLEVSQAMVAAGSKPLAFRKFIWNDDGKDELKYTVEIIKQ